MPSSARSVGGDRLVSVAFLCDVRQVSPLSRRKKKNTNKSGTGGSAQRAEVTRLSIDGARGTGSVGRRQRGRRLDLMMNTTWSGRTWRLESYRKSCRFFGKFKKLRHSVRNNGKNS